MWLPHLWSLYRSWKTTWHLGLHIWFTLHGDWQHIICTLKNLSRERNRSPGWKIFFWVADDKLMENSTSKLHFFHIILTTVWLSQFEWVTYDNRDVMLDLIKLKGESFWQHGVVGIPVLYSWHFSQVNQLKIAIVGVGSKEWFGLWFQ